MARMRSLKPEFFADEELGTLTTRDERLLYAGLWGLADEFSRLRGNPVYIRGQIFPYDEDLTDADVDAMLSTLEKLGKLVRYKVGASNYIYLKNLAKHQRLDSDKVPSRLPAPPSETVPDVGNGTVPDAVRESPALSRLHVAGSMEQAAGRAREKPVDETLTQLVSDSTGATHDEAVAVLALVKAQRGPRSLPALVRRLAADNDFGQFLDQVRADQEKDALAAFFAQARASPSCEHETAGGYLRHPRSGEPICVLCRVQTRAQSGSTS